MNNNHTVKVGAIGVGGIYKAHAQNLQMMGGNQVVAMCDMNEAHRAMADAIGARFYTSVSAMLEAEPELEAIISCTPPLARREVVQGAADFGQRNGRALPVFVEKPPAFSLEDARAINAIATHGGVPVVVGFMYRWFPIVNRLRELLAGRTIHLVQSAFLCPLTTKWTMPPWFLLKERSGGHILDQAIHSIDLIRFFAGDITQVHTYGNNIRRQKSADFTIEESSSTNLRFASGASGAHLHSWAADDMSVAVSFIGEDFRLNLDLDERLHGNIGEQKIDEQMVAMPEGASHHYAEMVAFLEAVRSGDYSTMRSPYSDAARSLATVIAMNESIESGKPVDVPSVAV